ncbi:MAG: hypothetical protein QOJ07_3190 [Thermoleophilaceae bacterium]|nr:hypothetical protein [Thermoleophilaceae bacterium]
MIEPRIYRAAFVPAALALLLVLFSFDRQPPAVPQPNAGDVVFDATSAATQARDLAHAAPDRRMGSRGDDATAALVQREFRARRFSTQVDTWSGDDGTKLHNVIGLRPGRLSRQIVIIAARDAHGVPDLGGSAADTAALLELARVLQGRAPRKTVLLVSTDGSAHGDEGARRFLEHTAQPSLIDAVIVADQLGAARSKGPLVVDWSNDHDRANLGLARTAQTALREELGSRPMTDSLLRQVPRMALPIGLGSQGVLLEGGLQAVRVSGSGELDPTGSRDLDAERYGKLGRSVVRLYSAINDGGKPEHGPSSYLTTGTRMLPGWTVSLFALALLLPPLIASVDALARARRQRATVARWFGWIATGLVALLVGWLLAEALVLVGAVDDPSPAPLQPASVSPGAAGFAVMLVSLLAVVGVWFVARRPAAARLGLMSRPGAGAGVAIALVLSVLGIVVWALNPFAALVLAPAVHLWMLAALTRVRRSAGFALIAVGALPLALVGLYYVAHFDLGPVNAAWYAFLLVTGHQAGVVATLAGCVLLALLAYVVALVAVRPDSGPAAPAGRERTSETRAAIFGPGGHSGPGALGSSGPAVRR